MLCVRMAEAIVDQTEMEVTQKYNIIIVLHCINIQLGHNIIDDNVHNKMFHGSRAFQIPACFACSSRPPSRSVVGPTLFARRRWAALPEHLREIKTSRRTRTSLRTRKGSFDKPMPDCFFNLLMLIREVDIILRLLAGPMDIVKNKFGAIFAAPALPSLTPRAARRRV
jgi:hypothetical protein